MEKITITIKTGNDAFTDTNGDHAPGFEIARILRGLAYVLSTNPAERDYPKSLVDYNGNRVGVIVTE